jgi:hypothetical protein
VAARLLQELVAASGFQARYMKKNILWIAIMRFLGVFFISLMAVQAFAGDRDEQARGRGGLPLIVASDETKPSPQEPDTIMFAAMSGKCSTLKVAGRDFGCRAVAYYQTEEGRGNFVVALDDPADNRHIITFSGENGRRPTDNLYELPIDRMLLKSQDRPTADGLPVPFVELSAGICKQVGSFATRQVSSVFCSATDTHGKKYELRFESDGLPIALKRVRRTKAGVPAVSPFDLVPE